MMEPIAEASPRFRANIAGVLFLTSILTGGAAAFVRWRLVVPGDAIATATNILAHEPLFRMLLAADLISVSCYVAVTLLFYEMFKAVNNRLSLLTAFFGFIGCGIVTFACIFHIAALFVLRGAQYLNILAVQPLPALALLCLKLRAQAYSISLVFFGFYCLLIGYLIFRSTFLPRIVGALMAFAGLSWLTFLSPPLAHHLSPYIVAPGLLGEGTLILWLLVIGVQPEGERKPI
ncbi:MAG TPA: DUF4386 domain-containing protein [Thermoanaerobaculia bacterium]|nr:DUF4386 domain-containing protein [Thermoanaerobaculia bacterium]